MITNISTTQKKFYIDYFLLCICTALLLIGFIMVTSSTLHLGEESVNNFYYPIKQFFHILAGIAVASVICCIPLRQWEKIGPWLFIIGIALLILVLLPGVGIKVKGSTRWISLAGLRIQVSEIVKFASVVYMASYVSRHQDDVLNSNYGLVKPLILFSIASFFLLLEPDFGSAVVILVIAMSVMYLSGAKLWQFIVLISTLTILAVLLVFFSAYRRARFTGFIDPWADPQNTGYQLIHALISFGRGEITGVGLGSGIEKLFYLPEAHTDFLFSVLAEELGLVGVILIISLFTLLLIHSFSLAAKAEQSGQKFAAFIAYGIGIWFGFQAFINMGVNMGMLPTKGLTLPLMSYGGGSMITMCATMALLFRVYSEIVGDQTDKTQQPTKGNTEWINV